MNMYDIQTIIRLFLTTIFDIVFYMLPYLILMGVFYLLDRYIGNWITWILTGFIITIVIVWEFKIRYDKEKKENSWFKSR